MSNYSLSRNLLRHKIILLENKNLSSIEQPEWQEVFEVFANVNSYSSGILSQIEGVSFGHVLSEEYMIFTIRFHSKIRKNMRIKFRDSFFEIKRIINDEMKNKIQKIISLEI